METRAHIHVASFEPIIHLLLGRLANAILIQSLTERWWDTTLTFHIVDREMTMTPHDFHFMTSVMGISSTWKVSQALS